MTVHFRRAGRIGLKLGILTLAAAAALGAQQAPIGIPPPALTQPSYALDTAEQHGIRVQVITRVLNHPLSIALPP